MGGPRVPACLMMLTPGLRAQGVRRLPAIVTRPGLVGCRYWRWLPRVRESCQPSASIRRMASRTLIATLEPYESCCPRSGGAERAGVSARGRLPGRAGGGELLRGELADDGDHEGVGDGAAADGGGEDGHGRLSG